MYENVQYYTEKGGLIPPILVSTVIKRCEHFQVSLFIHNQALIIHFLKKNKIITLIMIVDA